MTWEFVLWFSLAATIGCGITGGLYAVAAALRRIGTELYIRND